MEYYKRNDGSGCDRLFRRHFRRKDRMNDMLVCLDTSRMHNGECLVVEVDCGYDKVVVADTFGKFLYNYLKDE